MTEQIIQLASTSGRGTYAKLNSASTAALADRHEYFIVNGSELRAVREEDGHYVCEVYVYKGHAKPVLEKPTERKLSKDMFDCLKQLEGIELNDDGDAVAYQDIRQIWTIGYGSTDSKYAFEGNTITAEQADHLYRTELTFYVKQVNEHVLPAQLAKLTQKQFDCLVSFCFNIGHNGFKTSTALKKINAGRFDLVPHWMLQWNKPSALLNRRKHEAALWDDGPYELQY